jgi:hypothetical protein
VIPVSDKIKNLHDWLMLPPGMRRDSAGAAVVLGEIAASHADLLAACEEMYRVLRDGMTADYDEMTAALGRARAALAKARGA